MQPVVTGSKHSSRLFRKLCNRDARGVEGSTETYDGLQFLAVSNTLLYRHLAMTRVHTEDRAVEIGCSYGHATALLPCPSLGIDHAPEKVLEATQAYPHCRFATGDVFGEDLTFLDLTATVLLLDIGGGRDYKPVMKALAICSAVMPALRLVVAKSIEVVNFLLRFDDAVDTVARDFSTCKDDDAEAAAELASELHRWGGDVPLSLIERVRCGPRLRYVVGKQRMQAFLRQQAPLVELVEVPTGPADRRLRVRTTAESPVALAPRPAYAVAALREELACRIRRQLQDGEQWCFLAVFGRLPRGLFRRFMALAAEPELAWQASDPALGDHGEEVERWSDAWQSTLAMRHLHAFLVDSPEFRLVGEVAGEVPTLEELRSLGVVWSEQDPGMAESHDQVAEERSLTQEAEKGPRVVLQILDCDWSEGEGKVPEVRHLFVKRAWLLAGGQVAQQLPDNDPKKEAKPPQKNV